MTTLRSGLCLLLFAFTSLYISVAAQRPMEKLSRSVVASKVPQGVYINWRITADEYHNTSYRLYRNGTLIHETGITGASNFLDTSGTISSVYTVTRVKNGIESSHSPASIMLNNGMLEIPLRDLKPLGKTGYYPNDATTADLDGDGNYEIIIKRLNSDWSTGNTNYPYFEAYKLDGTFLWAIDVGPNLTSGVEINIAAFDFDGDGKAEVFLKTSEGTVFGDGKMIGDTDGDGITNYRYSVGGGEFMNAGPEFLSLVDGMTGAELDRANFIPRGNTSDWGDNYGHRANKFFFGAPYLDGVKPSIFTGRGIYTKTIMRTYDVVNKKLVLRWEFNSGNWGSAYHGQGNHNFTIADVDGDGRDEITWGSMAVDDDGRGLYSTGMGHGDAIHVSDFDPYRKGIEVFSCLENSPVYGTLFRDGKNGQILHHYILGRDCGRACAGNITDSFKGAELWGGGWGYSATNLVPQQHFGVAENFTIYWDGDLAKELLDHSGFSTSTGVGNGSITKFNSYGNISTLLTANANSCNYTKGTPCLQADILGDWREEAIWWRPDSMALRVYTTTHPTQHRIYTLMHDHHYRQAICWQMCGYNQPPHTSFYLGSDFPQPVSPKTTNGKWVWKGNSTDWNLAASNWMDGNDAVGLIAGTAPTQTFANGKSVLFDTRGASKTVNITTDIEPEMLTVSGQASYTIGGTGSLTGSMRLDKMGEGTLTLNGTHSFNGITDIWEGEMWLNGTLTNSPVQVRRHAAFGGKGSADNGITTEFNAGIYTGGKNNADTFKVKGDITLVEGARLFFDLSDNPTNPAEGHTNSSGLKNDLLIVDGNLNLHAKSIIDLDLTVQKLTPGSYLLARVNNFSGDLSKVKVEGATGTATELSFNTEDKSLWLVVKGVRNASTISWTGQSSNNWDLANSINWNNDGTEDIFVSNDTVVFDDNATRRSVNIAETLTPKHMVVNNSLLYSFDGTGKLSGAMTLHKTNSGTLTINNRNDFTGKVVVDGGTLVMKYAPTTTNTGGIGAEDSNPANFVVRDSAIVQFNTANEITSRGITFESTRGGIINVPVNIFFNGSIVGTKMTKTGTATLNIGSNNSNLQETELRAGTINLNAASAVPYGVGRKITLYGGTLATINSSGAYLTSGNHFDVPAGATATVIAGARCEYNGNLTGAGTLNWSVDFIRAYINGNWSAFSGKINLTKNAANSTYEDKFIVNNSAGFPNATINIASGVIMCYKNGTSDNGTTTLKIGMLTGEAGAVYHNAGLEVGGNNAGGTYAGIFTGVTSIRKTGTGLWLLSGENTNTGSTIVSGGTLNVSGKLGTGSISIGDQALFNLSGSAGGSAVVATGGTLQLNGSVAGGISNNGTLRGSGTIGGTATLGNGSFTQPGGAQIGILTFNSNLTLRSGARLSMQVNGGGTTCDILRINSTFVCEGMLEVVKYLGTFTEGNSYKIIEANTITGTFETINLPELPAGLAWDTETLYSDGTIKVIKDISGIQNPTLNTGLLENPTCGLFRIRTDYHMGALTLQVSDMNGRTVVNQQSFTNASGLIECDLTTEPSGLYLITITTENAERAVLRALKK